MPPSQVKGGIFFRKRDGDDEVNTGKIKFRQ
jgi:hypothetical protein